MILNSQRALERIAKGSLAPAYLLFGQELYWRDRIWSALRGAMGFDAGSSTGIEEMDLRRSSLEEVLSRAKDRNLWIPRQLILVRSAQQLTAAKLQPMQEYAVEPSPDSVIVFEMLDMDLENADWREKEKIKTRQEAWAELCDVILLVAPGMAESLELVRQEAAQRGRKISPQAAEELVAIFDRNLGHIVQEIDKLSLYVGGAQEISIRDVELISGGGSRSNLSLTDAIGAGDPAKVIECFDQTVPAGAYLPLIVAEVARYLRQLILIQESGARDPQEASRLLWSARLPASQSGISQLLRQARGAPRQNLIRSFQLAFQTDLALRSSPPDERLIVERYVLDVAALLRPLPQRVGSKSVNE